MFGRKRHTTAACVALCFIACCTLLFSETRADESGKDYRRWALPKAAKTRLGKGSIRGIQFSPDGTQLAVSSNIGVWLYDVQSGKEMSLFTGMCGSPVFSPDGRFLAHSGHDPYSSLGDSGWERGVKLWEVPTGRKVSFPDMPPVAAALRFSDNGKVLISLNKSRYTISRLDVETGERVENTLLGERPGSVHLETYALTEDKIAIGMHNGNIELWDTTTGKKLSTFRENAEKLQMPDELIGLIEDDNSVFALAFSPDGTQLASGSRDTTVQLWDTTFNQAPITLRKHTGWPTELAFSADGRLLASGGTDNTVQLWDTGTGESLATFTDHLSDIRALAFSPDGTTLASGSSDGTIRFWNTETMQPLPPHITEHIGELDAVILKDSSMLASVGGDGIITLWDLKTFGHITIQTKNTLERTLATDWAGTFVFSPDGTKLASSSLSLASILDNVLRLTDVSTGHELATFPVSGADMVLSPDGKIVAYGRRSDKIHLLNTETGKVVDMLLSDPNANPEMHHRPEVRTLIFSPDGKKLISGTEGGRVQMWDVVTGVALTSFFEEQPPIGNRYRDPIVALAFSSDGSTLAVGSLKRIRLLGSPKQTHFKEVSHSEDVWYKALVFSPDNTIIVRAIKDGKIQLWDIATGNTLATLDGHTFTVETLAFSADGKTFISAAQDGTILLWDWDKVLEDSPEQMNKEE